MPPREGGVGQPLQDSYIVTSPPYRPSFRRSAAAGAGGRSFSDADATFDGGQASRLIDELRPDQASGSTQRPEPALMNRHESDSPILLHRNEEAYLRLESKRLIDLKDADPGGRLLLVTTTFSGRRFASASWSSGDARRALLRVDRASDDLHLTFRAFYLKTLANAVDDFRHRNELQPMVIAFVDDRQDGDLEPYPHVHSVWFVPSGVVEPVRAWLGSSGAVRAWADLSEGGSLDVRDVDADPASVHRVVAYAGKLLVDAAGAGVATQGLCRTYPDRLSRKASEADQRPPQSHEAVRVRRDVDRPSRCRHGRRHVAPPLTVVWLRSRRAV